MLPAPRQTVPMTDQIRLLISANGVEIDGEGQVGGESGFIECQGFSDGVTTDQAPTGRSLGRRHYEPIVVRKRTDRTSPVLLKALSENQVVSASVQFLRPDETGMLEHYFTVEIPSGRIVSIERSWAIDGGEQREDVAIAGEAVVWTHEPTGTSYESRARRTL